MVAYPANPVTNTSFYGDPPRSNKLTVDPLIAFAVEKITESDLRSFYELIAALDALDSFINAFGEALALAMFADKNPDIEMRLRPIANRDAAINLYNFRDNVHTIRKRIKQCRPLANEKTDKSFEFAFAEFDMHFPDALNVRNAASHPVAYCLGKDGRVKNSVGNIKMYNNWNEFEVIFTISEKIMRLPFTIETIRTLQRLREIVFDITLGATLYGSQ